MKAAVVGVGTMGGGMALRLAGAGHDVTVFDLDRRKVDWLVRRGARAGTSPGAAAAGADFVVTSLPRDEHVREAITGAGGILETLAAGAVVIETSTVSPTVCRELEPLVQQRSASIVDAPVVTSQRKERREVPADLAHEPMNIGRRSAVSGNLSFFVGGTDEDLEQVAPLLDIMGLEHHHVGPLGAGASLKLINNAIVGTEVALLSEMIVLGRRAGIDGRRMVEILAASSANSVILNTHIGRFTVEDDFPAGLFPVDYMVKDLSLALGFAGTQEVECGVVDAALTLFREASNAGLGGSYNPVVIKAVEARSGRSGRSEAAG